MVTGRPAASSEFPVQLDALADETVSRRPRHHPLQKTLRDVDSSYKKMMKFTKKVALNSIHSNGTNRQAGISDLRTTEWDAQMILPDSYFGEVISFGRVRMHCSLHDIESHERLLGDAATFARRSGVSRLWD